MRFLLRLSEELGMTKAELLRGRGTLTPGYEIAEWMAEYRIRAEERRDSELESRSQSIARGRM